MPKKADPFADFSEQDQKDRAMLQETAVDLGRAIGLSCAAATHPSKSMRAEMLADKAWKALADKLILFAVSND